MLLRALPLWSSFHRSVVTFKQKTLGYIWPLRKDAGWLYRVHLALGIQCPSMQPSRLWARITICPFFIWSQSLNTFSRPGCPIIPFWGFILSFLQPALGNSFLLFISVFPQMWHFWTCSVKENIPFFAMAWCLQWITTGDISCCYSPYLLVIYLFLQSWCTVPQASAK